MSTPSHAKPVHFLLVEDDNAHAELVTMSLVENNVANTIQRVSDGEQALKYLKREGEYADADRPDLILLDLKLPKIDGLEVLERIKSDDDLHSIPVVVLTTSSHERDVNTAYNNYANSYLTKPVDFSQFHKMIRDLGLYWSVWNAPPVHR
ncbi:MAG: response regulator [Phycisphaerales bacterium JB061]